MIVQIFNTIAPVLACALVGYLWAKRGKPYDTNFVTRLVTNIGVPCLVLETLITTQLNGEILMLMGVAALISTVIFVMLSASILTVTKLDMHAYLPSMTFGNAGNIGLSICFLAFGQAGLALAIGYFTVINLLMVLFGPAMASGRISLQGVLRLPMVWAALGAIIVILADIELPTWTMRSLHMLGAVTIPLMLLTLGVSLADLNMGVLGRSLYLAALRLLIGIAVGLGLAELMAFENVARGVLIIQCAMPAAVFNYMFAQLYETRASEVASLVMVSTLMSFLSLPGLLWFVMI